MNREVNVTKRVQTSKGMRYCPVALSANGRIKPDAMMVNGRPERHTEGAYYLEWHQGAKRVRLSVGKDAAGARCLWAGVDLRTVQQWLGHSDMESTIR